MNAFDDVIGAASEEYGISPVLLKGLLYQESKFDPAAYNKKSGARGIAQFLPSTAEEVGINPDNPTEAIFGAAYYLKQQIDKFGSVDKGLAAYNWGMGNLGEAIKNHGDGWFDKAPDETKNYIAGVAEHSKRYENDFAARNVAAPPRNTEPDPSAPTPPVAASSPFDHGAMGRTTPYEPQAPERSWAELGQDVAKDLTRGAGMVVGSAAWLARKGIVEPYGRSTEGPNFAENTQFEQVLEGTSEAIADSKSEKDRWLNKKAEKLAADPNVRESIMDTGEFLIKNPSLALPTFLESLPQALIAGKAAGNVANAVYEHFISKALVQGPITVAMQQAAKEFATKAATIGASQTASFVEAMQSFAQVGRGIERKLDEAGVTDQQQRSSAMMIALPAGIMTYLGGRVVGGVAEARMFANKSLTPTGKSAVTDVLTTGAKEIPEEIIQTAGEGFFQNLGENEAAGTTEPLTKGLGYGTVMSAAVAGLQGSGSTMVSRAISRLEDKTTPIKAADEVMNTADVAGAAKAVAEQLSQVSVTGNAPTYDPSIDTTAIIPEDGLDEQQRTLNEIFSKNVGADGIATLRGIPLRAVPESAMPNAGTVEGDGRVTADGARALRSMFDAVGVKVIFYEDAGELDDGFAHPMAPNTIFLSNNPQRAADFVARHEFKHTLENEVAPDGRTWGDITLELGGIGITEAGIQHARNKFTTSIPAGATAEEIKSHYLNELLADTFSSVSKTKAFMGRAFDYARAKYGEGAAINFLTKMIDSFDAAFTKVQALFGGAPIDVSKAWFSNADEIHGVMAQMLGEKMGKTAVARSKATVAGTTVATGDTVSASPRTGVWNQEQERELNETLNKARDMGKNLTDDNIDEFDRLNNRGEELLEAKSAATGVPRYSPKAQDWMERNGVKSVKTNMSPEEMDGAATWSNEDEVDWQKKVERARTATGEEKSRLYAELDELKAERQLARYTKVGAFAEGGIKQSPKIEDIDDAAHQAATSPFNDLPQPTDGQKEAGNYKVGRIALQGMRISIENPAGSVRSGVSKNGNKWSNTMKSHYGYILGTVGKDKDHIDTFVGRNPASSKVFIVDQTNESGGFDEHKVMLGYNSAREARAAYLENYSKGWKGLGKLSATDVEGLKKWLSSGDTTKPYSAPKDPKWSEIQRDDARSMAIDNVLAKDDRDPPLRPRTQTRLTGIMDRLYKGEIDEREVAREVERLTTQLITKTEDDKISGRKPRVRGADHFREKILRAKRNGDISEQEADLAEWLVKQNSALFDDVALSMRTADGGTGSGNYTPLSKLITLFKGVNANDTRTVHEVLHHTERMMPRDVALPIRMEYFRQLAKEANNATGERREMFEVMVQSQFDGTEASRRRAVALMKDKSDYQFMNPSEFWAERGAVILAARMKAKDFGRVKQWMRELWQKIRSLLGLSSDAPLLRALDGILKGDGKFVSNEMLQVQGGVYADVTFRAKEVRTPEGKLAAPNGAASNLTTEQWHQVRSPEFKNWFGDWEKAHNGENGNGVHAVDFPVSKVVDDNGEPRVVFHGSKEAGFTKFDPSRSSNTQGKTLFFSSQRDVSRTYSGTREETILADEYEEGGYESARGIYSVFLNIRNPYETDFEGANWDGQRDLEQREVFDENDENVYTADGKRVMDEAEARQLAESNENYRVERAGNHYETTHSVARNEVRGSQDGAIVYNVVDDGGEYETYDTSTVYIVGDATQIKSAIGNTGAFDPANPDIRYSPKILKPEVAETLGPYVKALKPAEAAKFRRDTAEKFRDIITTLPAVDEVAAVAYAGRAKRGWYAHSAEAMVHVFGADAPRFAALLAAMSPQTSVEINLLNTAGTWQGWVRAGKPTDRDQIIRIMGQNVQGNNLTDSVLGAWINNSVRALTSENPGQLVLSGPKVNSFYSNLIGITDEVTNDAWMANYALVDQKIFAGGLNAAGTDPGKGPGYLAMSAQVRLAARRLTKLTGETWTPAEVQETVWSWAKTLYEQSNVMDRAIDIVNARELSDELIQSTPDFRTLFHDESVDKALRAAGHGRELDSLSDRRDISWSPDEGSTARSQTAPFAEDTQLALERRGAKRLDKLAKQRAAAKADTIAARDEDDIQFSPKVNFEVAPDPNDKKAVARWTQLSEAQKFAISDRVARRVVPGYLDSIGADGDLMPQIGSYLDDTNPSFVLTVTKGDPLQIAKDLGYALSQDSMMVVSDKPLEGGEQHGAVDIELGQKTPAEIAEIYATLRKARPGADNPISGQSYSDGYMTVLNFSSLPTEALAEIIDNSLGGKYNVVSHDVYSTLIEKKDYGYGNSQSNTGRNSPAVRLREGAVRQRVAQAIGDEFARTGAQFSPRVSGPYGPGDTEFGRGAARGNQQGKPGAVSGTGVHYSTADRKALTASYFGTGYKGAELERVRAATDPRIQQRIYFYVNDGRGINRESGVGPYAHKAELSNVYDAAADTLDLAPGRTANEFESAVLDAGFDGYTVPGRGAAVLLGPRTVKVEPLGIGVTPEVGQFGRADKSPRGKLQQMIAENKLLPAGEVPGEMWKRMLPELDLSHLADDEKYYKDQLLKFSPKENVYTVGDRSDLPDPENYFEPGHNYAVFHNGDFMQSFKTAKEAAAFAKVEREMFGTKFSPKAPIFYSQMARVIDQLMGKAEPAKELAAKVGAWARAGKYKADELQWSGLADWLQLQDGKVTKAQVAEYLANDGVQVTETVLGEGPKELERVFEDADYEIFYDAVAEQYEFVDQKGYTISYEELPRNLQRAVDNASDQNEGIPTKFSNWQLPGGENYRELLLTLPEKTLSQAESIEREALRNKALNLTDSEMQRLGDLNAIALGRTSSKDFRSSHFDQPNILAHVRLNERTDADGKRVLFVEEMQSDWAQKGRKEGFEDGKKTQADYYQAARTALEKNDLLGFDSRQEAFFAIRDNADWQTRWEVTDQADADALNNWRNAPNAKGFSIPSAPFVGNTSGWTTLAFKRMLRYAAENGFDKIAWTTGEQQAARYDLSKQVKRITYQITGDNNYQVRVFDKNNDAIAGIPPTLDADGIEQYVGKEIAKQIVETADRTPRAISGENLKVGGEGMKSFYDKIIPAEINKYVKRWGGKVEETAISFDHDASNNDMKSWTGADGAVLGVLRNGGEIYVSQLSNEDLIRNEAELREYIAENGAPDGYYLGDKQGMSAQPSLTITPEMKASALEGQPLFSPKLAPGISPPEETRLQLVQRTIQDKFNRFKVIYNWAKENGIPLSESANVYMMEALSYGRRATRVEDFREQVFQPIIEAMEKAKLPMATVSDYLHAMHAEERNDAVAKKNSKYPDGGSGMSTAAANAILTAYGTPEMKAIVARIHGITRATLKMKLDAQLISQETFDTLTNAYQNYVPLKGGDEVVATGTGKGYDVNHRMKRALGHSFREEAILENIMRDHETAIALVEKQRVGLSLAQLAIELADPDLLTVGQPEKRAVLKAGAATYEVRYDGGTVDVLHNLKDARASMAFHMKQMGDPKKWAVVKHSGSDRVAYEASPMLQENEARFYINGEPIRIQIKDPMMAREYKNMGVDRIVGVLKIGREVNAWLSKAYTGYNPEFIGVNIMRDFTEGIINLTGDFGAVTTAKVVAAYLPAMKNLAVFAATGKATRDIADYRADGGSTGASYLSDLERIGEDIHRAYNDYAGVLDTAKRDGGLAATRVASDKLIAKAVHVIEIANQAAENAMRLATYNALRAEGKSRNVAALAAKDVTLNFNRKGERGAQMSAFYLFFNPAMQGAARSLQTLLASEHRAQAWVLVGGMMALGYALASLGAGIDEEKWDKTPNYVKGHNLVIPLPSGKQITLPMPYGYGFFLSLGTVANNLQRGKDIKDSVWLLANAFAESYSPLGNPVGEKPDSDNLVQLLPTLARIPMEIVNNRSGLGGTIYPEKSPWQAGKPDSSTMFRGTKGSVWDYAAGGLNRATGGNPAQAGWVDVHPDVLKSLWSTATGGSGRFATDSAQLINLVARGATPELREYPLIRKFLREENIGDARREFWEAAEEVRKLSGEASTAKAIRTQGTKSGNLTLAKQMEIVQSEISAQNGALLGLSSMVTNYKTQIAMKRERADAVLADTSLPLAKRREQVKVIEAEEKQIYDKFMVLFRERKAASGSRAP